MTTPKRKLGDYGEALAEQHLIHEGYAIVARNWRCKFGELDIIAQKETLTVFIEVKTRRTANIEDAILAITLKKREKLVSAIYHYLEQHHLPDSDWRFDLIAVALPHNQTPIVEHMEDILEW